MASIEDYAEELAKEAMGNWRKFESFGWHDRPYDAERWAIIYTHSRDSGLLAQSNASVYERVLEAEEYEADVRAEHHGHWACGWIDGYAIRVRDDMLQLTPAWIAYCELKLAESEYPALDEDDYSQREYDAACEAISSELSALDADDIEPSAVFDWLWEHEQSELENVDDQGACPSREAIERAYQALRPPVYTAADIGCYANGNTFGHYEVRSVLARMLEEHFGDIARDLVYDLRAEMSDDASEELEALEKLNELCAEGVHFEMIDGDLMLVEDESEEL